MTRPPPVTIYIILHIFSHYKQQKNIFYHQLSFILVHIPQYYNRIPLLADLLDLFLTVLSAQGVVAAKNEAFWLELDLLDTVRCPKIIAVLDGPYWARVGLVFKPFLTPRCCPNRFSTMS